MKKIYFLLLTVLFAAISNAQTTLISPTGDGGFENGATFLANGWTVVNGATNQWFVGAVSTPSAGTNSAYISDNVTGTTYNYNVGIASTVHFYRDVTFPAGETNIVLSFKWKGQGEGNYDYVTVYSMPTGVTPTFNNPAGAFQSWLNIPTAYAGAVVHASPPNLNLQSAYQTQTICLPAAYAGTTRRLVFMFSNDPSLGTQPPGSIDEISLVTSLPPTAPANSPTALNLMAFSTVQINGSFTAAAGSPDGYLTVRYPTGAATTAPANGTTYSAGATLGLGKVVSSSAATTFNATGLSPSTTYDFYVYSYNTAPCASGPLYKVSSPLFGTQTTNSPANIISTGAGGLWSLPATWVGGIVPNGGDNATIVDGATVTIDISPTVTNLTIGGGASGILEYEQTTARTLTVSGNAIIGTGGIFRSNAAGTVITHVLSVGGNLTNNGTLDFSTNANTAGAQITFTGAADAGFDCSAATLTDLQQTSGVTLNKGTSSTTLLNFTPGASGTHTVLGANAVGFLTITNGTFKIIGTNTFSSPVFNAAGYTVPGTGGIWLTNTNATIAGLTGSPTMSGLLRMTSGIYNVGTSAGNSMSGATTSTFIIEGGTMNFASRLLVTSAAPCSFTMSSGVININTVGNTSSASPSFGFTSTTSFFTMSGGTINLVQATTTGATLQDYQVSSVPNITGGTLNVGTAATATNFIFRIQGATPAVVVDNTTNAKTATLSATTIVYGDLTITTGASWNHNATTGFTAQVHGNVVNNGSIVGTAASSRFDFISVTNTARTYSGTGTFGTAAVPFAGVGVGLINTGNVTLTAPILANRYNLFRGTFINSAAQITIGAPANVTTQVVQRGAGSSTAGAFDGAPTFNIGTGGLVLIYAAATTMTTTGVEIPASRSVFQVNIGNLNGTTLAGGPLAITSLLTFAGGNFITSAANLPTVTNSATTSVTGFSAASYVVGPLARTFLASLAGASTYDFPVGTATTYNNIQMLPTTTAAATLAVAQWQANTGPSGGTPDGATITSLDPVKYWSGQINANAASFTSTVYKITDGGFSANSRMAQSATQAGVYAAISPAPVASVLTSTAQATLNFIQIGSIGTTISGTKTVCSSGCDYTSLTAAGGAFADINSKIVNGNITLQIAGDITIEDGTNQLNEFTSPHTITIKPTGVARAVSGTAAAGLITLNGADRVTIDGSLGGTVNTVCPLVSASRDLTITNNNAGSSSAVVWIQTALLGPNPAQNNTVMNCNIVGTASLSTGTLIGIGSGSSTVSASSLGTNNNNINFINNNISKTQIGIYHVGISAPSKNQGAIINQNLINTLAPNNVTSTGIMVGFLNNGTISGNNVSGMALTSSPDVAGINVGFTNSGFSATSPGTQECTNMTITKNIIGSVVNTGTFSAVGLGVASSTLGTNLIANNMISGVDGNGTSGDFSSGLVIGGTTGSVTNVYHNTVSMQGTITGGTAASQVASALSIILTSSPPVIDIRNNIFSNTQAGNAGATARFTAITTNYGPGFQMSGITLNNNDLYSAGAGPGTYAVGQTISNTVGTLSTTLANWQSTTGKDALSKNVLPVFISATDLHLQTNANCALDGGGVAVSVTDDIDCQTRTNFDIGADEFTNATTTITYTGSPYCSNAGTATVTQTGNAGGTYSSTAGLVINSGTGAVTLGTSTPGTYTVTYTLAALGSCPLFTTTASITITAAPAATISYAGSPYCANAGTATVTQTGTTGGTYSSTAGLTINGATGTVTLGTSTPGTYTVTYTIAAAGGCALFSTTASITITATPAATISYAGSPYCSNGGTATVTRTGTAGGTYSATPAGLTLNAANGDVTLGTSTPGTYTVTYTIAAAGGCALFSTTTSITITQLPAATISYAGTPYCSNAGTATVTQTGTAGGTYSSTAGLTLNAATGAVTLGTSTPGTYTVTYTIAASAGCGVVTATTSITITALPAATISYAGSPYCSSAGTATVTRTGTAGGTYSSTAGLTLNAATGDVTLGTSTPGTYTVTYTIAASGGCPAVTATASITVTAANAATISYAGTPYCSTVASAPVTRTGTAGGTYTAAPAGLTINASTGTVTPNTSTPGTYTVTYTMAATGGCPGATATTSITITQAPNMIIFYAGTPYCSNAGTATVSQFGTTGGTYSASPAGLSINAATGAVTLGTSTPGTYTVTYSVTAPGCGTTITQTTITVTAAPNATIAYTGSPYCSNAGTANVTLTGTAGGTYSSTAGLSLNAATGAVNLAASTAGTYTVTYTVAASGGCATYTTTATITITTLPAATIAYTGSPYCSNAGTATVTRTGTAGGTYTAAPAGLSINAATGDVNLAASTAGTYTVTYTIAAGGGCPAVTATASITITAVPAATISYAGNPFCQPGGIATVTRTGTAGGTYNSAPAGLSINAVTGDINIATSTPGTYTVTYTLAAGGGCLAVTATTSVTVNSLSTAPTAATATSTSLCTPGTVTLSVTGGSLGSGATWRWYSGSCGGTLVGTGATLIVTVNTTTTYFVRAEGPCNTTTCASVTVAVNVQPTISIAAAPRTTLLPGQTTTLTATFTPAAGNTFIWYRNGDPLPGASVTKLEVGIDGLGTYTARVTTAAGCTALSNAVTIIAEISTFVFVYPNPNAGQFQVRVYNPLGKQLTVIVYKSNTQLVYRKTMVTSAPYTRMDVDLRNVAGGEYNVVVVDSDGTIIGTRKVMIAR